MASQQDYHDWMWHLIYLGTPTAKQQAEMTKMNAERARESIGKGAAPMSALEELKARREAAIAGTQRPDV